MVRLRIHCCFIASFREKKINLTNLIFKMCSVPDPRPFDLDPICTVEYAGPGSCCR
jgi:hypothetical protein